MASGFRFDKLSICSAPNLLGEHDVKNVEVTLPSVVVVKVQVLVDFGQFLNVFVRVPLAHFLGILSTYVSHYGMALSQVQV